MKDKMKKKDFFFKKKGFKSLKSRNVYLTAHLSGFRIGDKTNLP